MTTIPLHWLSASQSGLVTWGSPWPRGRVYRTGDIALIRHDRLLPVQSWPLATWPDGSLKWTAHATSVAPGEGDLRLESADEPPHQNASTDPPTLRVVRAKDHIDLDTGTVVWHINLTGQVVCSATIGEQTVIDQVRLTSLHQTGHDNDLIRAPRETRPGAIATVAIEQAGPVRAVVLLTGTYSGWLPFRLRLIAYAGSHDLKAVHTITWDGDPEADVLAGLGLSVDVPLSDRCYNRHVRLAGSRQPDGTIGCFTEAVQPITGQRRDPGPAVRQAQVNGRDSGTIEGWDPAVSERLKWIPTWSDFTLDQSSPDGYTLIKRTDSRHGWIHAPAGTRSEGYAYLGGISGGAGIGVRNFWQQYPTRLDIRGAASPTGQLTAWLWSPSAPAFDPRPYHDGLGQTGWADQLDALEITYEDWEPGFNDARGIAKTHELTISAYPSTPPAEELAQTIIDLQDPPLLLPVPSAIHAAGVFGSWSLPDRSTPFGAKVEDRLDLLAGFYADQRDERRWYGCFDYGDVMHGYDPDRHTWRYDIGGYAWDNSELSTDLWLWYAFLRSGRVDLYRMAEAMTRHTGEVDVYHTGPWAGLGSRHNVQHWGCSAKQLRVSNAVYRRMFYYLSADERTGELLDETAGSEQALLHVDATRKVREDSYAPDPRRLAVSLGTDYGALAGAWLTAWERHGDTAARDKLLNTMRGLAALPQGFLTGEALVDIDTGVIDTSRDRIQVSHLAAVFGMAEICDELIALTEGTPFEVPGFKDAWIRYCRLYLASSEQQVAELGQPLTGISLIQAYSRLSAYAARASNDEALRETAWRAFIVGTGDMINRNALQHQLQWTVREIGGPQVQRPVHEATYISTNDAAQYGLAAIEILELLGNEPPTQLVGP